MQTAVLGNPAAKLPSSAGASADSRCRRLHLVQRCVALQNDGMRLVAALERRGLSCATRSPTGCPPDGDAHGQARNLACHRTDGRQRRAEPDSGGQSDRRKQYGCRPAQAARRGRLSDPDRRRARRSPAGRRGPSWALLISTATSTGGRKPPLAGRAAPPRKADRCLLGHGWQQVVVVTDHGWLLLPGGLPKVELPQHLTVLRKGPVRRAQRGTQTDQQTVPWRLGRRRAHRRGGGHRVATGRRKNTSTAGLSPQECVVPVIWRFRAGFD